MKPVTQLAVGTLLFALGSVALYFVALPVCVSEPEIMVTKIMIAGGLVGAVVGLFGLFMEFLNS